MYRKRNGNTQPNAGRAACVVSVNTATIHIAAAIQTPAVVLYAQTNPQHTPWKSPYVLLPFSVTRELRSKNPIIRHVADRLYHEEIPFPEPDRVVDAVKQLLNFTDTDLALACVAARVFSINR
ncbi:glycosyltransferase family 9 protein [Dyadobacter sp. 22481]|uniref:glycosyltransferase family 9 protein n=1 Tax=Dyadobacter sp. 22481 TaxID=3453926 RepID=UPI003F827DA4